MWNKVARFIIRYRIILLLILAALTGIMLYHARNVRMTYSAPQVIPTSDPKYAAYLNFKKQFGEDGNVMVLGIQTDQLFTKKIFNAWSNLAQQIKTVSGVEEVVCIGKSVIFNRDTVNRKLL